MLFHYQFFVLSIYRATNGLSPKNFTISNTNSALTTFRKETEEGEELELHGAEVSALMNLVATDTMVEEVRIRDYLKGSGVLLFLTLRRTA